MVRPFDIFLVCPPGLEPQLLAEAREIGLAGPKAVPGGVTAQGGWEGVRRANMRSRGATRVLARIAEFRATNPGQLESEARQIDWGAFLRADVPVRIDATSRKSKLYHAGAARERVERAVSSALGCAIDPEAPVAVKVRIEANVVTISADTSGEPLHKRGHKQWIGKAPLRETMAALLLRACGYDGSEPVVDPMCGSGTIVLEAAEIAMGLLPGRDRSFAFEYMAGHDPAALDALRTEPRGTDLRFQGSDRDAGAVRGAAQNAERAGVDKIVCFARETVSGLVPPDGPPGLVLVNPPYGARIGDRRQLFALHGSLGKTLAQRFAGWRVGIVTSDGGLAQATGLDLTAGPPIAHGGMTVTLYQTGPL